VNSPRGTSIIIKINTYICYSKHKQVYRKCYNIVFYLSDFKALGVMFVVIT